MDENFVFEQCGRFRQWIDSRCEGDAIESDHQTELDLHLAACVACNRYKQELQDIIESTKHITQFDVSEALTQRIVAAVGLDRSSRVSRQSMILMTVLAAALSAFVLTDSMESVDGLYSWLIGAAVLLLLKYFLVGADQPISRAH